MTRESTDIAVVEPVGNYSLLRTLKPLDGLGLLIEVSGVFDLGFNGLELVADFRR